MKDKDLLLNSRGDIEIGFDGDIARVDGDDVRVQDIIFRLKTYKGDYELEPECGASIEDFIGLPNTAELGKHIEERVIRALTHDGLFLDGEVGVRVSPLSLTSVIIRVTFVGKSGRRYDTVSALDLMSGKLQIQTGI